MEMFVLRRCFWRPLLLLGGWRQGLWGHAGGSFWLGDSTGFGPSFGAGVTLPGCSWFWCELCPGLIYRLAINPRDGCSHLGGIARLGDPVLSCGQICHAEIRAPAMKGV